MRAIVLSLVVCALVGIAAAEMCKDENPFPTKSFLMPGEELASGKSLDAKAARLTLKTDGNLVLIRYRDNATIWSSQTSGMPAKRLRMSTKSLTLVDETGNIEYWRAEFDAPSIGIAVVQDDCAFAIYERAPFEGQAWMSNTPMCIEAHIVAHSHDDVGWLLTPERYYDGCQTPGCGVRWILTSVVDDLAANPNHTFAQVESYFFNRWWLEQNETTKDTVRRLAKNGQLEFINGGWSMHDEACVHQESAISNMEVGARFLKDQVGVDIKIGWHIDPFGHASATPRYMAEMGFDAFFFWRTDYEHRDYMLKHKTVESLWYNSKSLKENTLMFTSIMYNNYCYGCSDNTCPSGFCSYSCEYTDSWYNNGEALGYSPVMAMLAAHAAAPKTTLAQLQARVGAFGAQANGATTPPTIKLIAEQYVNSIRTYETAFRTGNVLMPWGCDFEHQHAEIGYDLMDQVMEYIMDNYATYGINIFWSTPSRYVKAVKERDYRWTMNHFDYFIDSDNGHAYWSGYFTSRAEYKGFERWAMNQRSGVEIAMSNIPPTGLDIPTELARVEVLREALGVAQHHDSITGTERTPVRNQYQFMLTRGLHNTSLVWADILNLTTGVTAQPCMLSNLSYCPLTTPLASGVNVSMYVFNPLMQSRDEVLTVPIPTPTLGAYVATIGALTTQVVPTWELTTTTDNTSPPIPSHHKYQAYIQVRIPAMTLIEIVLSPMPSSQSSQATPSYLPSGGVTIRNEKYAVQFRGDTGRVSSIMNIATGKSSHVEEAIEYYCPMNSLNNEQASGAYIMRTCTPDASLTPYNTNYTAVVVQGPLCTEVRQYVSNSSNIHQAWRVCQGQDYIEMTSGIGEVETLGTGVEIILRLRTEVASNGVWYTDSQALEMQRRERNARPNYPYTVTEPIAANFFPCNAFASMNNSRMGQNISVMADRSRATASLVDGEFQFLVQRRLLYDDNRGVNEPLDETTRVLTTSRIVMNSASAEADMRLNSQRMTHQPIVHFGTPSGMSSFPNFPPLNAELPPQIHLHTRTVHAPGEMILRLQHLFEEGEGSLATSVNVSLASALPAGLTVLNVTETDINGIRNAVDLQRLAFKACDNGKVSTVPPVPFTNPLAPVSGTAAQTATVEMRPMEIRTFKIFFQW